MKIKFKEAFNIYAPLNDDLIKFKTDKERPLFPFVSRTARNNGVSNYVNEREGYLNEGNVISLALDGSSGSTFYQENPFYSGQNIWIVVPKDYALTKPLGLYLVSIISQLSKTSTYADNLTKTRLSNKIIELPGKAGKVDWNRVNVEATRIFNENYSLNKMNKIIFNQPNIDAQKWKKFRITEIFENIHYPKNRKVSGYDISKRFIKGYIPFVSAKKLENGVTGFVNPEEIDGSLEKANVITVANNGSIGFSQYREYEFVSNTDVTILDDPKIFTKNKDNMIFVASLIRGVASKTFSYGNKLKGDKLKEMVIPLPITKNGTIDEKFIMSLNEQNKRTS